MPADWKDTIKYMALSFILLCGIFVFGYYIAVNSFFEDKALPNIYVQDYNASLKPQSEIQSYIQTKYYQDLPSKVMVNLDGYSFEFKTKNVIQSVSTEDVVNFGKGKNVFKVIGEGIDLISGAEVEIEYEVDTQAFADAIPLELNSLDPVRIVNNEIVGCESGGYSIPLSEEKISYALSQNRIFEGSIDLTFDDIAENISDTIFIDYCEKYNKEKIFLETTIKKEYDLVDIDYDIDNLFALKVDENRQAFWDIKNQSELENILLNYKEKTFRPPTAAAQEIVNGRVLVLGKSTEGSSLLLDQSKVNVAEWLSDPSQVLSLSFSNLHAENPNSNLETLDFSKKIATGQTRIDLIRHGRPNWTVPNAQAGIEEIHNTIVMPGEEFSYIETINPYNVGNSYYTQSGRPIGGGTCNSTTTLFRAALESGFPITDRSNHTQNIYSYRWGYPEPIVDAAYYTDPVVDLKFINDMDYPILLRTRFERDNHGYQYHYIDIMTDNRAKDRDVEITNWQRWNQRSETRFSGSFDRIVREDGREIRRDRFISHYTK